MPLQMNEAITLKTHQIVKNPSLSLGLSPKDVAKYKKVAAAYGNVAPVVVAAPKNGKYLILDGSARLEACTRTGIHEIPAVMAHAGDEPEQLKLALMLSATNSEGGALSEGALISRLINEYGVTPRELVNLLGKSKAWVSKRMSLAQNLTGVVKNMVTDGTLCPRSAEEVAKLPEGVQCEFSTNVINCGLNKTEIGQLVRRYKNTQSDDERTRLIKNPLEALTQTTVRLHKKTVTGTGCNGPSRKLASSANYAAQMMLKVVNMAENTNNEALLAAEPQLNRLRVIAVETDMTLNRLLCDVSLGKQGGEAT